MGFALAIDSALLRAKPKHAALSQSLVQPCCSKEDETSDSQCRLMYFKLTMMEGMKPGTC